GIAMDLPDAVGPAATAAAARGGTQLAEDLAETADFIRGWIDGRAELSRYERAYLTWMRDPQLVGFGLIAARPLLGVTARVERGADGGARLAVETRNWKVGHDFP